MAEEKHGALIVIERADPLDGMIQKGTSLHAEISSALIESIFIPAIRFMTEPYWSEKTGLYQQPMCFRSQQNMSISNTGRATGLRWDFRPSLMHSCSLFQKKREKCLLLKTADCIRLFRRGRFIRNNKKMGILYPFNINKVNIFTFFCIGVIV